MTALLNVATKARSGSTLALRRGLLWLCPGDLVQFRAAASVAAATPFDIGKGLSISAQSPLSVHVKHQSTGATEEVATLQPAELVATIPERYCGVRVKSMGGNIVLPGLTETYLEACTDGQGAVNVGKIKANSASITSSQGSITGSITATDIKVESAGGDVMLKRVAGNHAQIRSQGGQISIDVLQVATGNVASSGGTISIGQVTPYTDDVSEAGGRGAEAVQVRSAGGGITVQGLDGSVSIDSGGGHVVLQCTSNMKQGIVRSHGGDVSIFAPPGMQLQMHATGGKGVEIPAGCAITGDHCQHAPTMLQGCLHVQEPQASADEGRASGVGEELTLRSAGDARNVRATSARAAPCTDRVGDDATTRKPLLISVAGHGAVKITARSWRDSMLHRLALKKSAAA